MRQKNLDHDFVGVQDEEDEDVRRERRDNNKLALLL